MKRCVLSYTAELTLLYLHECGFMNNTNKFVLLFSLTRSLEILFLSYSKRSIPNLRERVMT